MKRPLVMVGLLYGAGVLAGRWISAAPAVLGGATLALGLIALLWIRARPALLWALLPLAGWTNYAFHTVVLAPDDLRTLLAHGPELVELRGKIAVNPATRIIERHGQETWRSSAVIETKAILRQGVWEQAYGRVSASAPGLLDSNYFAGREVAIRGVLRPPEGPLAPGLFDARKFYADAGIYFQLRAEATNDWRLMSPNEKPPLSAVFLPWARRTLSRGLPEEDEASQLLWALALDDKTALTATTEEPFLQTGAYHIFAVDGLRLGILAGICLALLRVARVPRAWCGAVVIPLIWGYAGLTGWPPSAMRAVIMLTVVVFGWALRRPADLVNSLFVAAFVILCWDARQLFQAGFQLSFVMVFCLAILIPPARQVIYERMFRPDPFLPDSLARQPPLWLTAASRYVIDMLLLSGAAWLAAIPLSAYYFHLFTPWSFPANFLVVPLTSLALMSCLGSLMCGAWLPAVSELFNHAGWFWMKCILAVTHWLAAARPAALHVAAPDLLALGWYYIVLLTVVSGWIFRTRQRRAAWAGLAVMSAAVAGQWAWEQRFTCITALPARGGSVVFVNQPAMLLDCGPAAYTDSVLKPFLQAQGVNRLRHFCLTSDHVQQNGGAQVIETNFAIGQIDTSLTHGIGDGWDGWQVLNPAHERHARADDDALVLQKKISGWNILLLSRLGRAGQDELRARGGDLRSDLVIAGLPAQDEPLSEPLLDALAPKVVVLIDADLPATRRASEKLRARLERRGVRMWYGHDGSLTVRICAGNLNIIDAAGNVLGTIID
ncbi:MAG TPA: ComEC/Rec2 family competence protein [Verrucomicrobiae bacterium]|jgi:ComEC/Rec2-related protein|nr:ComEC/Rec2 family competence protein [Verrucomicrobiae bacterium]